MKRADRNNIQTFWIWDLQVNLVSQRAVCQDRLSLNCLFTLTWKHLKSCTSFQVKTSLSLPGREASTDLKSDLIHLQKLFNKHAETRADGRETASDADTLGMLGADIQRRCSDITDLCGLSDGERESGTNSRAFWEKTSEVVNIKQAKRARESFLRDRKTSAGKSIWVRIRQQECYWQKKHVLYSEPQKQLHTIHNIKTNKITTTKKQCEVLLAPPTGCSIHHSHNMNKLHTDDLSESSRCFQTQTHYIYLSKDTFSKFIQHVDTNTAICLTPGGAPKRPEAPAVFRCPR